ncbi:universal stress protein [Glutamicibacter sp. BW80]|uniref:universal stress protein n=1 Tax=unclassified Glutamicibacter TaxID=2627139 RepID=UPI000BB75673|nr:universal stress protein [Glutamicibacter sp. BW80]PCC30295.1 universal stress protein [Glutamicibacter sp. BW80]
MNLLVGYTADQRGAEAIELAAALVQGTMSPSLVIGIVLPASTPFSAVYPGGDHGFDSILSAKVDEWAAHALNQVPAGVTVRVVARSVPSVAEGLMELAEETGAHGIVLGGRKRHRAGFFMPGAVANALLHASSVSVIMSSPQALASLRAAQGRITRMTAFVGDRPGAREVIASAAKFATARGVGLRVATLVADSDVSDPATELNQHLVLTRKFLTELTDSMGLQASVEVVSGQSLDAAIESLEWIDGEFAILGSARLATTRRLFIGPKAQRILRQLNVPMAVVPN